MDPISAVTGWFRRLAMGRVHGAKASMKGKLYGHQARVKGKVAGAFNKSVDGAVKGAKGKVGGRAGNKSAKVAKTKKKGPAMGWFGGKKKGANPAPSEDPPSVEHTVAVSAAEMVEEFQECVGWVVARNGPQKGKDWRLTQGKNVLGTEADCDVVLTDPYLSSKHAVIRYEDGEFTLVDLDSTNGALVNNTRVVKTVLVDNDSIRIGRTTLKFKALE